MSVDVFGRQLDQSRGKRGPPGAGYQLTEDGQYDIQNKRLCNVSKPQQQNDAVNVSFLKDWVDSEVKSFYPITTRLRTELDDVKLEIQVAKDEIREEIKSLRIELDNSKEEIGEKIKSIEAALQTIYDLLDNAHEKHDDASKTSGGTSQASTT